LNIGRRLGLRVWKPVGRGTTKLYVDACRTMLRGGVGSVTSPRGGKGEYKVDDGFRSGLSLGFFEGGEEDEVVDAVEDDDEDEEEESPSWTSLSAGPSSIARLLGESRSSSSDFRVASVLLKRFLRVDTTMEALKGVRTE